LESDGFNHTSESQLAGVPQAACDFLGIQEGESKENHAAWWDFPWHHQVPAARSGSSRCGDVVGAAGGANTWTGATR